MRNETLIGKSRSSCGAGRFATGLLVALLAVIPASCIRQDRREPEALSSMRCGSAEERLECRTDPSACVCEAFGDCEMRNCLAMGEVVAAQRAQSPPPSAAAAVEAEEAPARAPVPPPAPEPSPVAAALSAPAADESAPRSCRDANDLEQCSQESYYCPCEAYGDCGKAHCVEPRVKPREAAHQCRSDDDKDLCRTDPRSCPCSVNGLCGMPECGS